MFLSSGIDTVMMSMYTNVSVGYNPLLVVSPIYIISYIYIYMNIFFFFFLVSFCGLGASQKWSLLRIYVHYHKSWMQTSYQMICTHVESNT